MPKPSKLAPKEGYRSPRVSYDPHEAGGDVVQGECFHSSPLELPTETRRFSGEFEGEVEDFVYLDDIDLGLTGVTTNTSQSHIFPSARALTASAS